MTTALEDPRWLALSKERQSKLLEECRDVNVEYDWWDGLFEDFVEQLTEIGITVDTHEVKLMNGKTRQDPNIYFSGFWSQGDGACFAGSVSDWPKFLATLGRENWAGWAEECSWTALSACSYGNNMFVSSELGAPENPHDEEEDPLRFHAWNVAYLPPSEADLAALESEIESKFEELASKLYDDLKAEYDYQTDDEQVVDWVLNHLDDEELIGEEAEEFSAE
jgi:hypothetical protein